MKLSVKFPLGRIVFPGEVFTGAGSIAALRYLEGDRFCIVTTHSVFSNSYFKDNVEKIFKNKIFKIIVLASGEPAISNLQEYSNVVNDFMPDWIISIGGGSIIDSAKILWVKYEQIGIGSNELFKPFYIKDLGVKSKFAAIPTTAGTGSEVSSSAVCYESDVNKYKKFVVSHELLPSVVILDVNLLKSLPRDVKLNGLLDAITHAVEGYTSPYSNDIVKDYAILSLQLIQQNLHEYFAENSEASIQAILRASHYSGYVQNMAIPGLAHAVSHALSRENIAHGLGCGFSLPHVIQYNCLSNKCYRLYSEMAARLNFSNVDTLLNFINSLIPSELANSIRPVAIDALTDAEVLANMRIDPTYRANPVEIDIPSFLKILGAGL